MKTDNELAIIGERLRTQDNRVTEHPMFCVQEKKRDVGYDSAYSDNYCWVDSANDNLIYDDDKDFKGEPEGDEWDKFGYRDHWETVMVAFTEVGCQQYINLNGHNHQGELRIYAESFRRCPEMILIREMLLALTPTMSQGSKSGDIKQAELRGLRYALGIVQGRRVLNRTTSYLAAVDEMEIFLMAAIERVENGEQMESVAICQTTPPMKQEGEGV